MMYMLLLGSSFSCGLLWHDGMVWLISLGLYTVFMVKGLHLYSAFHTFMVKKCFTKPLIQPCTHNCPPLGSCFPAFRLQCLAKDTLTCGPTLPTSTIYLYIYIHTYTHSGCTPVQTCREVDFHDYIYVYAVYLRVLFHYFPVELSFAHVHVEDSASPELWKHCGHQTSWADPSHSSPHWIAHQRGLNACRVGLIQAVELEGFWFKIFLLTDFKHNEELSSSWNPDSYVIRQIHFAFKWFCLR